MQASLSCLTASSCSFPQLNSVSLVVSRVRGRAFFENPATNRLLKFRNPKNACTSLTVVGVGHSYMSLILSWLI